MDKRSMGPLRCSFLLALVSLCLSTLGVFADIPQSERDALVALYNSTGGASWTNRTNWLGAPGTESTWFGVMTDPQNTTVIYLNLASNNLSGTISPLVANLSNLEQIDLGNNALAGQIPAEIGGLSNLKGLFLYGNSLTGSIPAELGNIPQLQDIVLSGNRLSGEIPLQVVGIPTLRQLSLSFNDISGPIPPELGNRDQMQYLFLSGNMLEGEIPPQLGSLSLLTDLYLDGNFLGGNIPPEIGNLASLQTLYLASNKLSGEIPASLMNLTSLGAGKLRLELNALYSSNGTLTSFLNSRQVGGNWLASQTVAPAGVSAATGGSGGVNLSWTPIQFTANAGGYSVYYSQNPGPPYTLFGTTPNKSASSLEVTGLQPGETYYFVVQTETAPHHQNRNTVVSDFSEEVSAAAGLECVVNCAATAPATGTAGSPLAFSASFTTAGCTGSPDFYWDFGDGGFSQEQNPEYIYQSAGTYGWSLTAISGETECTRGGTIEIAAGCSLECWGWAPEMGRPGVEVQFESDGTASGCSGSPLFNWSFGDGGTSPLQNPAHAYAAAGFYHWTFKLTAGGRECTSEGDIRIEPSNCTLVCTAEATPDAGRAPLEVSFSATANASPDCLGEPSFIWQFGDGGTSEEHAPYYAYQNPGTFTWTVTVTQDGASCRQSGSVEVGRPAARLSGDVGIWEEEFMLLDGPGVSGEVVAREVGTGEIHRASLAGGTFQFADLPLGRYEIRADLTYEDHITYDASLLGFGCPAPPGGIIRKPVSSEPLTLDFEWEETIRIEFPPPVVMLHGILSCYGRWYSAESSIPEAENYWDNFSRRSGIISFTPSYTWWGSQSTWTNKADQVVSQLGQDLGGLHRAAGPGDSSPYIRYHLIGHGMGGLVARVMTSGPLWDDPVVREIYSIFTLGTPNSGTDLLLGGGGNTIVSVNSIVRQFNEIYPDFGERTWDLYAIGGDKGWWGLRNGDGPVSLYSAFNIARIDCWEEIPGFPQCVGYPAISFDSEEGHVFNYSHTELGSPASAVEILQGVIIPIVKPQWQLRSGSARGGEPDSPAGALVWGTNSRTVTSVSKSSTGKAKPGSQAQDYGFTLSMSDGMAAVAFVHQGSAKIEVIDPTGKVVNPETALERVTDETPPFEFTLVNPAPGEWILRVTPGAEGASYDATIVENSPFGISAFPAKEAYIAGETTVLRVDADGDLTDVIFGGARATVFGLSGEEIATVDLLDDGAHYDGEPGDGHFGGIYTAPASEGSYQLRFEASGTFRGAAFRRTLLNRLTVVSAGHVFDGSSSSSPMDRDGNGKMDALKITVGLLVPSAVYYEVEGSLYDSEDNWIDYSCASVIATAPGSASAELQFSLSEAFCGQYGKPFYLRELNAVDGFTLLPVDSAPNPIQAGIYQAADSDCTEGVPHPEIYAIWPDQGMVGQSLPLSISGADFKEGARVAFDSGVTVNGVSRLSENLLSLSISVLPDATVGYHAVTVTNPDGSNAVSGEAFEVVRNEPPEVWVNSPWEGEILKGEVVISAGVWDDTGVSRVSFLIDGVVKGTCDAFPFQYAWDSRSVSDGSHEVKAVAVDDLGLSASSYPVPISVDNITVPGDCDGDAAVSIGEVQKAINMFLGTLEPGCDADCNGDWTVSIGELQKVINAFLGLPSSC